MNDSSGSTDHLSADDRPTGPMTPPVWDDTDEFAATEDTLPGVQPSLDAPAEAPSTKRLVSASALMAAGTMSSRVLGFVRVMLLAYLLTNSSRQADMYELATVVPTSLYILFAGGALNTVLVPQIVRAVKDDPDGGEAYTNRIMTAFLLIIGTIAGLLTIGSPIVLGHIYANASWRVPEMAAHYQSLVFLGYLTLPSIFFYGVFFLLGQVLNAHDRFGPMMWAPLANNVVQIVVLLTYLGVWGRGDQDQLSQPFTTGQAVLLGGGATFGIASQTLVMMWFMRKLDFRFRPRFDLKGTGLGHTFQLAKWTLGFVLVNQIAVVVVNNLATSATVAGAGAGVAAYNRAYLIFVLPHSLITVSLATAMLPSASRMAAAGDLVGVRRETMRTIKLATSILLPAAAAFIALAMPVTKLMFGAGKAGDSQYVGWTLIAFAIGLVPFTIQYICLRAFYALEDTRATFVQQCFIAALNIALAIGFVVPVARPELVAPGLALAYSLSYVFGLLLSFSRLGRRLPGLSLTVLVRHLARVAIAIAPGAVLAWWITTKFPQTMLMQVAAMALGGVLAVASFFALAKVLRIREVNDIIATLLRRRSGATEAPVEQATDQGSVIADEADHLADEDTIEREVVTAPFPDEDEVDPLATLIGPLPDPAGDSVEDTAEDVHPVKVRAGFLLGGRYRLEEVMIRRATTQTWRAFDDVLSRPVLVHLLPAREDHETTFEAARRSAIATDSRFLRVLDVARAGERERTQFDPKHGEDRETGLGAFIVCEYAPGVSLENLLATGPLSALEAAWLVREVADALAGMHDEGLYHRRISPDTVVITAAGNIKIVGFLLEASMSPGRRNPVLDTHDAETIDIIDLGRLLYCSLVARWPGGTAYGMAAAPTDSDGALFTPRQVRAGVSPALDRICDLILSESPRGREMPLRTAREVVDELNRVLGSADASHDLERRLRFPVPVVEVGPESGTPAPTGATAVGAADEPMTVGPTVSSQITPSDAEPTIATPIPAPAPAVVPRPATRPSTRNPWLMRLIVLVVIVLIGSLIAVALNQAPKGTRATPTPTPVAPVVIKPAAVTDFDPEGDTREEHRSEAPLAIDGDPATAWTTVQYRNPTMDKSGVGLIVDLGRPVKVASVAVTLRGTGSTVEARVPAENATADKAPTEAMKQWKKIGEQAGAGEQVEIGIGEPVETRWLLIDFTRLPKQGQTHQGAISEITVRGN